jgi:hypothetical protein
VLAGGQDVAELQKMKDATQQAEAEKREMMALLEQERAEREAIDAQLAALKAKLVSGANASPAKLEGPTSPEKPPEMSLAVRLPVHRHACVLQSTCRYQFADELPQFNKRGCHLGVGQADTTAEDAAGPEGKELQYSASASFSNRHAEVAAAQKAARSEDEQVFDLPSTRRHMIMVYPLPAWIGNDCMESCCRRVGLVVSAGL